MSVREFNGTSDYVTLTITGSMRFRFSDATNGATWLAVLKRNSTTPDVVIAPGDSGNLWAAFIQANGSGNGIAIYENPTGTILDGSSVVTADGWVMCGLTKTAGSSNVIAHKLVLDGASSWSHTTGDLGNALAYTPANTATLLGADSTDTPQDFFAGRMAVIGAWNTALSNGTIETLEPQQFGDMDALETAWLATSPQGMWRLDQASTGTAITDLTGNGSDQSALSGTTVINGDDPPFSRVYEETGTGISG